MRDENSTKALHYDIIDVDMNSNPNVLYVRTYKYENNNASVLTKIKKIKPQEWLILVITIAAIIITIYFIAK